MSKRVQFRFPIFLLLFAIFFVYLLIVVGFTSAWSFYWGWGKFWY